MSLRCNERDKDTAIEYKESVGPIHHALAYQIRDEINKPIEIVRRNDFNVLEDARDTTGD